MSVELNQLFMECVKEQRECEGINELQHKLWQHKQPSELIEQTKKYHIGAS